MPFTKFTTSSLEQSHTNDPENLPIFLIPGILGNGNELYSLAAAINEQRKGKTPIYIYEEPIVDGEPLQLSLDNLAASIAQEVLEIRQNSPLPYILVGYSFGGILAAEVARKLLSVNHDPRLYVVDEPAESCVKRYFDSDSDTGLTSDKDKDRDAFKTDLFNIVNYAAKLSGLQQVELSKSILGSLQFLELEDRIDHLADNVLKQQTQTIPVSNEQTYSTYLEIAKRNLRNLKDSVSNPEQKLSNVHTIFTKETARKYGSEKHSLNQFKGDWDLCSTKITQLNPLISSKLGNQSHMDLLKEDNAALVAGLLTNNLKIEITPDFLMMRQIQAILGGSVQQEKMNVIIDQLFNKTHKRSSMQFFNIYNAHDNTAKLASSDKAKSATTDEASCVIEIKAIAEQPHQPASLSI
jgi:thioesterase domain-containing protein